MPNTPQTIMSKRKQRKEHFMGQAPGVSVIKHFSLFLTDKRGQISWSVRPWQAFTASSNICGKATNLSEKEVPERCSTPVVYSLTRKY
jgi:hypothetical protein